MLSILLLASAVSDIGYGEVVYCKGAAVQAELTTCAWNAYKRADQEMNNVWRKLHVKADSKDAADVAVLKSQRAFLVYREQTCIVPYLRESPGTMAKMEQANCLAEITERRVVELQKIFR